MNISQALANKTTEPTIRTATQPTSLSGTGKSDPSNANGTASVPNGTPGAGPASTVTISSDARNALRTAGVSANEISHINLKDKGAVARAIQRAKMTRAQHSANGAKSSGKGAINANAGPHDAKPENPDSAHVSASSSDSNAKPSTSSTEKYPSVHSAA